MHPFVADEHVVGRDYRTTRLPKADYENCIFEECQFQEGFLDNQNFTECRFVGCDLTNANLAHTTFNEVVFEECKLMGIRFDVLNPVLLSLQFKNCNLSLASFYEMKLPNTRFIACKLHQADFAFSDLERSQFPDSDLKNAIFESTNLRHADFRTAVDFNIDPTINSLNKALFSRENLIGLLKKYDIVVEY